MSLARIGKRRVPRSECLRGRSIRSNTYPNVERKKTMRLKTFVLGSIAIAVMLSSMPVSAADDVADLQEQLKSLQARIDTMEQAKMDKVQKEEMAKMMKDILDDAKMQPAMPKWMKNLTFFGDFRLEYRMDHYSGRPAGLSGVNEGKDSNRARFRLRFGFKKTWWDNQLAVVFRLASDQGNYHGEQDGGTLTGYQANSADVNFGRGFNKKYIGIDWAYAKYQPKWAKGLTLLGGKMPNPLHTKTYISWDEDVTPEGFAIDYVAPFFGDIKPYAQVGYWVLGQNNFDRAGDDGGTLRDSTLWTFSTGLDWKINQDMASFFGVTYYQWQNYPQVPGNGVVGSNNNGVWGTNPHTNMGMIELTSKFSWKMLSLPWQVWGTWMHNCKDNYGRQNVPSYEYERNFKDQDNAFALGLKVGQNKKKGDWSAGFDFYYVEGNAVPWFTTDSNYGGPNAKGWKMHGKYNVDDFLTVGGELYVHNPIEGGTWGSSSAGIADPGYGRDTTVTLRLLANWEF